MQREIKFRAWLPGINQMSFSQTLPELIGFVAPKDFPSDAIWLQYTGLKDKNGKEIYEDDVVLFNGHNLRVGFGAYIEVWERDCPKTGHNAIGWHMFDIEEGYIKSLLTSWILPDMAQLEVVGNIYENPELLKS